MIRISTALFLGLLLLAAQPAVAMHDGSVRLQTRLCDGEVTGLVARGGLAANGQRAMRLPEGTRLIGQCRIMGEGDNRSFVILWSAIDAGSPLRPTQMNGAPFGTTVVPAKCKDGCDVPALPADINVPIHLRDTLPRLWDGGA